MSKFSEISEDVSKYFFNIFDKQTTLGHYVTVKLLNNDQLKHLIEVKKFTEPVAYLLNKEILISINEKVFDLLEDKQRELLILEALQSIEYDSEKDQLKLATPDVQTYSPIIKKYTIDTYLETQEILITAIEQTQPPKKEKGAKKGSKTNN